MRGIACLRRAACAALLGAALAFGETSPAHEVVLLYGLDQRVPAYVEMADAIRKEFAAATDVEPIDLFPEFFDEVNFSGAGDQRTFADYLRNKYADRNIGAVLAVSSSAVSFLTAHRNDVFPGVPVVFAVIETSPQAVNVPDYASAVLIPFDPSRTIDLARRLQPNLRNLFVIEDTSPLGVPKRAALRSSLDESSATLQVRYLDAPLADLLDEVRNLPPESMILYDRVFDDGRGRKVDPETVAQELADRANAPIYGLHAGYVGRGVVGGWVTPLASLGTEAARRVLRVLRGEPNPKVTKVGAGYVVDSRAMARWGFQPARLPLATEQRFAEPSIWKLYQGWIITLLLLVALQFALIVALLIQSISRRKDRLALAEDMHRFRLARVAGQVGFWQWDPATDRVTVEPELRELLGYDSSQRDSIDWRAHVYEQDLPAVLSAARKHVRGRRPYFEIQHRIVDRHHTRRWFLLRGQVLRDRDQHPIHMVGIAIDITERKSADDERARNLSQLQEQRIELAHLGRAAAAGALSGTLAHELKQPLSAILSNAQAGQRYLRKTDMEREELAAILVDIESDGRRAGKVIRHLRDLLHHGDEHSELVQIDGVIDDVLHLVRSDLVSRNVRVTVAPMTHLPPILADRIQLQQVVLNLLNNAADAMTHTEPRDRRIVIGASGDQTQVHLFVSDNGCGFGSENPDRIFKPFVTTKRHGLGLGLSISRSIVETHGGRIWAENNTAGGATLHVELPCASRSNVAPPLHIVPPRDAAG